MIAALALAAVLQGPPPALHRLEGAIVAGQSFAIDGDSYTARRLPPWFHTMQAPRAVAVDACGRGPRGHVIPGVEVWSSSWRSDGIVFCRNGFVAQP